MNEILDALTNAQNAEELALFATGLFTVLFQWAKRTVPSDALLPISFAVGAGIGILGLYFGDAETATVMSYVIAALTNAAIPTGWFKAGQYVGKIKGRRGAAPSADV